jgi:vitellogenic carboxypeptidase-like protein
MTMKYLALCCALAFVSARKRGPALKYGRLDDDLTHPCANGECGETLNLTPMLGDPAAAQAAALVQPPIGNLTSYSGFFTTDAAVNNNMFWWYFPAQNGDADAPLVIWLQGGPGGASTFGLFAEMGPIVLVKDASDPTGFRVEDRPTSWNKEYGMLFIDNPVGAGFSYTTEDGGYCTDTKDCVARNLYALLEQFYGVFPKQLDVGLWVTGESYGGHYVPAISYYIHQKNKDAASPPKVRIPLLGCAIGDGWIDPVNMLPGYPDMLYNQGLLSEPERATVAQMSDEAAALIVAGNYKESFDVWDKMLNGDVWPYGNLFHNLTGLNDYDNFMNTDPPEELDYFGPFLSSPSVRKALHVGNHTMQSGHDCEMHLLSDFMVSLKTELAVLMDEPAYRVLVYSGQLDVIIGAALTERFLPTVDWSGAAEYKTAAKAVWRINGDDTHVAGYARQVKNFTQVIIRGAGHLCPFDQPERSRDMIRRLIENKPYENQPDPVKQEL